MSPSISSLVEGRNPAQPFKIWRVVGFRELHMGQRGFDWIFHWAKLSGVGRLSEPARSTNDIYLEGSPDEIQFQTDSRVTMSLNLDWTCKPSSWASHLAALWVLSCFATAAFKGSCSHSISRKLQWVYRVFSSLQEWVCMRRDTLPASEISSAEPDANQA